MTDFTSTQSVEVNLLAAEYPDSVEYSHELAFEFDMRCTVRSCPGSFNPIDGGHPPEGPEFELDEIRVLDSDGHESLYSTVTFDLLVALVGQEIADKLMEAAETEAAESGEF